MGEPLGEGGKSGLGLLSHRRECAGVSRDAQTAQEKLIIATLKMSAKRRAAPPVEVGIDYGAEAPRPLEGARAAGLTTLPAVPLSAWG